MLKIKNTQVWGLERALHSSGNPMTFGDIDTIPTERSDYDNPDRDLKRGVSLGSSPVGSAHDHYLLGIHVQADINYPQYWTIEAERYHNFEIIASQSKMHRLTFMMRDGKINDNMFNEYVDLDLIEKIKTYVSKYNETEDSNEVDKKYYFMKALSNLPMGFQLWMTIDLTYLQLKTIYFQRKNHKLEDWHIFCEWCEGLPKFKELIGIA